MNYPSPSEYGEALQAPQISILDPELKTGRVESDNWGLPFGRTGAFAITFKVLAQGRSHAYRCFLQNRPTMHKRYDAISKKLVSLRLPYFVDFTFIDEGIRVKGQNYPTLRMTWANGQPLGLYIQEHHTDTGRMTALQQQIQGLALALQAAGISHGDIQGGNILVGSGGELKLVDYDGMYVPSITKLGAIETGHPNFQHPERTRLQPFDAKVDQFSFALLHTVIGALVEEPNLWDRLSADPDKILLGVSDLVSPYNSPAFDALLTLQNTGKFAKSLQALASAPYETIPEFTDFLNGRNIPQSKRRAGTSAATSRATTASPAAPWYQQPEVTIGTGLTSPKPTNTDALSGLSGVGVTPRTKAASAKKSGAGPSHLLTPQPLSLQAKQAIAIIVAIILGLGLLLWFAASLPQPGRNSSQLVEVSDGIFEANDCLARDVNNVYREYKCSQKEALYQIRKTGGTCSATQKKVVFPDQTLCLQQIKPDLNDVTTGDCLDLNSYPAECSSGSAIYEVTKVAASSTVCRDGEVPYEVFDNNGRFLCVAQFAEFETCVTGETYEDACFSGLEWIYVGCWIDAYNANLQQQDEAAKLWKVVQRNISTNDNCSGDYPWTIEFTQEAPSAGTTEYRIYVPRTDDFPDTYDYLTVTVSKVTVT